MGTPLVVALARGPGATLDRPAEPSGGSAVRANSGRGLRRRSVFRSTLKAGARVEGIEPDASLVRNPRHRRQIRTIPLGPGVLPPGTYDLVLMLDVLEHIADDRGAAVLALEALRPGGYLLLTVPALPWLWSRHDEANAHVRRYLPRTIRTVLSDAKFEVETVRYAFAWTVAPMVLRRWMAPAGSKRWAADYHVTIPPAPVNGSLGMVSRAEHALGAISDGRWGVRSWRSAPAVSLMELWVSGGTALLLARFRAE